MELFGGGYRHDTDGSYMTETFPSELDDGHEPHTGYIRARRRIL